MMAASLPDAPAALARVTDWIAANAALLGASLEDEATWPWARGSEEHWWHALLLVKPFRSVYANDGDGDDMRLIAPRRENLSQTPREQAELEGLLTWS
jgi:hypothetical protein